MRIGGIDRVRVILKGMIVFGIDSFLLISSAHSRIDFKLVRSSEYTTGAFPVSDLEE